ncbi:Cyclin, N-terminal [Dillenia turbinata]|uniref:Cyclin, N-terminal n=1 Tax=Dillenia turbinata TaxID=194707 RepID=A0AAN8ZI45_9MAGN
MEESQSSQLSLSTLICPENDSCLDEDEHDSFISSDSLDNQYEEYVRMLVEQERINYSNNTNQCPSNHEIWFKCARFDAVTWILNTRAFFGFRYKTAYLSVTYLDRFLSKRAINREKIWAIQLLSVACMSLAAKMEECKVPMLSDYQSQAEEYKFENEVIQRMELLVLDTLEWRLSSITPFSFLHFFLHKLFNTNPSKSTTTLSALVQLILASIQEMNLNDHRPSSIAAAAALALLDQKLTPEELESKIKSISICGLLDIDDVLSCYKQMQLIEIEKLEMPKSTVSPNISPINFRSCVSEKFSATSGISSKRKRLTFGDTGQSYE